MATDALAYQDYVAGRLQWLRRTAYLLCGDWHTADDLVSITLTKLFRRWHRASTLDNIDAYVWRALLNTWLDERRRPWRRERSVAVLPDVAAAVPDPEQRLALLACLDELPPRRRAVLVLRYFCDLSVRDTAEALGCSEGTVKSQASDALDTLRVRLADAINFEGEPLWT